MRARTVRLAAPLIVAAGLLAACGTSSGGTSSRHNESSAAPKTELADGVKALGAANSLTMTLRLNTTAANLIKIDREHGDMGADAIPQAIADAVTADHVSIEVQAPAGATVADLGKPGTQKGAALAITIGDSSQNYFSLLEVNRSLYARLDLKYFLGVGNQSARYAVVQHQVSQAPAFVKDFIAGKWVSLPFSTLQSIEGLAEGELKGLKKSLPSQSKINGLRSQLVSALVSDITVARPTTGSTDHLVVSADVRTLLRDEYGVIKPFIDSTAGTFGGASIPTPDFSQIPPITPKVDAYVSGGALTKLSLDAGQFDNQVKYTLPIDLDYSTDGAAITAPAGATPIDFSALGQLFAAASSVSASSGSSTPVAVTSHSKAHTK